MQPAAAIHQFGDVVQQQVEQVQQQVVLFLQHVVAHPHLVAQLAQVLLHRLQWLPGLPVVQFLAHLPRLAFQFRRLLQQAGQYRAEGVAQHVAQALGLAVAVHFQVDGADVLVDQLAQQAAVALPLLGVVGALHQPADVAQFAVQRGHAQGKGVQQRLRHVRTGEQALQRGVAAGGPGRRGPLRGAGRGLGLRLAAGEDAAESDGGRWGIGAVGHRGCSGAVRGGGEGRFPLSAPARIA